MARSIKPSDDIMKIVRRESELQSRSITGQIAHWVRIGRTIEKSGNFDRARIITPESMLRLLVKSRLPSLPTKKRMSGSAALSRRWGKPQPARRDFLLGVGSLDWA